MYSKNQLLYKTGLKRAWVSWAKSENGRENAMGRHNLYNLAAYLCQEFWVVFLPLPPSLTSPSTSPPPSVELFFNKRPPSPCGWGDKPLLFTRKFWWHIDFGNLSRFHDFQRKHHPRLNVWPAALTLLSPGFCSELPLENTYWLGSRQIAKENQRNTGEDNWDRRNKEVTVRGWKTGWRECRGDALLPHHLNYSVV